MSKIQIYQKTEGKTKNRNDDFIYAVNIANTRALGILGDFTSDSSIGDNISCRSDLKRFVEGRQEGWRRELTDGKKIIEDVANCVNKWMREYAGTKSRTTLVAVLYDGYEGKLYYTVQGDSGLAVVGEDGVRYIHKGDTTGTRAAAGFLPIETGFQVGSVDKIDPSAVIFAYTDGFWENTSLANEGDNKIREIFTPDKDWEGIVANISKEIFGRSRRKDDLSVLVFKGEKMNTSGSGKTLEERFDKLEERVRVVNEESPFERDLLKKFAEFHSVQDAISVLSGKIDTLGTNLSNKISELDKKMSKIESVLETTSFTLTKRTLQQLRQRYVPETIITRLKSMEDELYIDVKLFVNNLKAAIGDDDYNKYGQFIFEYADRRVIDFNEYRKHLIRYIITLIHDNEYLNEQIRTLKSEAGSKKSVSADQLPRHKEDREKIPVSSKSEAGSKKLALPNQPPRHEEDKEKIPVSSKLEAGSKKPASANQLPRPNGSLNLIPNDFEGRIYDYIPQSYFCKRLYAPQGWFGKKLFYDASDDFRDDIESFYKMLAKQRKEIIIPSATSQQFEFMLRGKKAYIQREMIDQEIMNCLQEGEVIPIRKICGLWLDKLENMVSQFDKNSDKYRSKRQKLITMWMKNEKSEDPHDNEESSSFFKGFQYLLTPEGLLTSTLVIAVIFIAIFVILLSRDIGYKPSSSVTTTTTTLPTASTNYRILSDDSGDESIWYVESEQGKKIPLPDALQKISGFRDKDIFTFYKLRNKFLDTMRQGDISLSEEDVKSLTEFSLKEGKLFTEESLEPFIKNGFMTVENFFILVLIIAVIFIATVLYKTINSDTDTMSTTVKGLFILIIFIAALSWGLAVIWDKSSPEDKASSSVTTTTLPTASTNYSFLSDDSGNEPIWYVIYDQDKRVLLPDALQKISSFRDKKPFTFHELREELLETMKRDGNISLSEADVKSLTEISLKEGKLFTEESLEFFIKPGTETGEPDVRNSADSDLVTASLKELLRKMDKTEQQFEDEINCLEETLTMLEDTIDSAPKGSMLNINLTCEGIDKDKITIKVADWTKQKPLPIKRICKLWLQIQVKAASLDGAAGSGTKKKFLEKFPDSDDIYLKLIGTDWNTD